jgi:hypothetical protein
VHLPVQAGVIAVGGFGLGASLFALICAWPSTMSAMKLTLRFAPNGWPTALEFRSLGHGITPAANDPAASGSKFHYIVDIVN